MLTACIRIKYVMLLTQLRTEIFIPIALFDIDMKYGGFLYLWDQTCWYDIFNGECCKKWNKRIKKWLREEMSVYFSRACRAAYFTQGHVYIYMIYIPMHVIYVFLL